MRQDVYEDILYSPLAPFVVGFVQALLRQLDVPVAVGVPNEVVYGVGGVAQFEVVEISRHLADRVVEGGSNPAVGQGQVRPLGHEGFVVIRQVHDDELGSIPNLIGKVAVRFDPSPSVETHVVARRYCPSRG